MERLQHEIHEREKILARQKDEVGDSSIPKSKLISQCFSHRQINYTFLFVKK